MDTSAIDVYADLVTSSRASGDRASEAAALLSLGGALNAAGRFGEAAERCTAALAMWRELGDRAHEAATLIEIGATLAGSRRFEDALEILRKALALLTDAELPPRHRTLCAIGDALIGLGRFDDAAAEFELARPLEAALPEPFRGAADAGLRRGKVGWVERNLPLWRRMAAEYAESGDAAREAETWRGIGYATAHDLGRPDEAVVAYLRAVEIWRALGDGAHEAGALLDLGAAQTATDVPAAVETFRLAAGRYRDLGDQAGLARALELTRLAERSVPARNRLARRLGRRSPTTERSPRRP